MIPREGGALEESVLQQFLAIDVFHFEIMLRYANQLNGKACIKVSYARKERLSFTVSVSRFGKLDELRSENVNAGSKVLRERFIKAL